MKRTRDFIRYQRHRTIARKLAIIKKTGHWYVKEGYEGILSKGKIHCSCCLCSERVNTKAKMKKRGFGRWVGELTSYKFSQKKVIYSMSEQLEEYYEEAQYSSYADPREV